MPKVQQTLWQHSVKCLVNMPNKLFVMIGVPGSGKSTVAKQLAVAYDARIVSTDAIRKEICGDESCQDRNAEVFSIFNRRIYGGIRHGNIIADGTNTHVKDWKKYFDMCPPDTEVIAVVLEVDAEVANERQKGRERQVPEEVIDRMWNTLSMNLPRLEEVFGQNILRFY